MTPSMKKSEVKIASPCTLDWRKMTPAQGGRFCGDCKKVVRDLSSMSEREARALMKAPGSAELCVRFVYDRHGKIFFGGDAPAPALIPPSLLRRAKRAAVTAAAAALPLAMQACSSPANEASASDRARLNQHYPSPDQNEVMGGMAEPNDRPSDDTSDAAADAHAEGGRDAGTDAIDNDAEPYIPPT